MAQRMFAFGEVHTGLLQHSRALTGAQATELFRQDVPGRAVWHSDRPNLRTVSPDRLTGVDCLLPTLSGSIQGVGTVVSHAVLTGGHLLQGSAYTEVRHTGSGVRQPWPHYLARPGIVEMLDHGTRHVAHSFLQGASAPGMLRLGAVADAAMNRVQFSSRLDHRTVLRAPRTSVRWVIVTPVETERPPLFAVIDDTMRVVRMPERAVDLGAVVTLCEDIALHDWLLTTVGSLLARSLTGTPAQVTARLRPVIDHLLHQWMPDARTERVLADVWVDLELRPGFTRHWRGIVAQVRDQFSISSGTVLAD